MSVSAFSSDIKEEPFEFIGRSKQHSLQYKIVPVTRNQQIQTLFNEKKIAGKGWKQMDFGGNNNRGIYANKTHVFKVLTEEQILFIFKIKNHLKALKQKGNAIAWKNKRQFIKIQYSGNKVVYGILLPKAEGASLNDLLLSGRSSQAYAKALAQSLSSLHGKCYMHGDLQGENIRGKQLIDLDGVTQTVYQKDAMKIDLMYLILHNALNHDKCRVPLLADNGFLQAFIDEYTQALPSLKSSFYESLQALSDFMNMQGHSEKALDKQLELVFGTSLEYLPDSVKNLCSALKSHQFSTAVKTGIYNVLWNYAPVKTTLKNFVNSLNPFSWIF